MTVAPPAGKTTEFPDRLFEYWLDQEKFLQLSRGNGKRGSNVMQTFSKLGTGVLHFQVLIFILARVRGQRVENVSRDVNAALSFVVALGVDDIVDCRRISLAVCVIGMISPPVIQWKLYKFL